MASFSTCSLAALLLCAGTAAAAPSLVLTGLGATDISPNGEFVVGSFYDAARNSYPVLRYTIGGVLFNTGGVLTDGNIRSSDDGNVLSYGDFNFENLNNGANSIVYDLPNLWERTAIAHRWSALGGSVNMGCASNGNKCDNSINTPYDISGNGRYIIVSGWSTRACGPFRCWRVDSQGVGTAAWSELPVSFSGPPANALGTSIRGNAINGDGSVIGGYDRNYNAAQTTLLRRPAIWVRDAANTSWTQTILDQDGGEVYNVSGDGTVAVGMNHSNVATRWIRTGSTWAAAASMGAGVQAPYCVSGDGGTVVGDSFIWNAAINGGVAMDLAAYLTSQGLDLNSQHLAIGSPAGSSVSCFSDSGNAIGVYITNHTDPCLTNFTAGVIYLNGHDCVAPTTIMPPASDLHVEIGHVGYYYYGVILNAPVAGTWPITYQWQKWDSVAGAWSDLIDDVPCDVGYQQSDYNIKSSHGAQLRIGFYNDVNFGDPSWRGHYRCVATNACGSVTSSFATIRTCAADYNGDGVADFFDYLDFVDGFSGNSEFADFNRDEVIDFFDYLDFVDAFSAGC